MYLLNPLMIFENSEWKNKISWRDKILPFFLFFNFGFNLLLSNCINFFVFCFKYFKRVFSSFFTWHEKLQKNSKEYLRLTIRKKSAANLSCYFVDKN